MVYFFQEGRPPKCKSANHERVSHVTPNDQLIIRIEKELQIITRNRFGCGLTGCQFNLAAARFLEREQNQGQQQPGKAGPNERITPSRGTGKLTAQQISQGGTDGNSHIKNSQRIVALSASKRIGDQAGADGGVTCFAESDQDAIEEENPKAGGKPG